MKSNAGQPFDPVRVVIFRDQLGPFPYPADLVEPAASRFRRDLNAVSRFERGCERGTTPTGAPPTIRTRGRFESGPQGACEPRHPDRRLDSDRELTGLVNLDAEASSAIRPHNTVPTRA